MLCVYLFVSVVILQRLVTISALNNNNIIIIATTSMAP